MLLQLRVVLFQQWHGLAACKWACMNGKQLIFHLIGWESKAPSERNHCECQKVSFDPGMGGQSPKLIGTPQTEQKTHSQIAIEPCMSGCGCILKMSLRKQWTTVCMTCAKLITENMANVAWIFIGQNLTLARTNQKPKKSVSEMDDSNSKRLTMKPSFCEHCITCERTNFYVTNMDNHVAPMDKTSKHLSKEAWAQFGNWHTLTGRTQQWHLPDGMTIGKGFVTCHQAGTHSFALKCQCWQGTVRTLALNNTLNLAMDVTVNQYTSWASMLTAKSAFVFALWS